MVCLVAGLWTSPAAPAGAVLSPGDRAAATTAPYFPVAPPATRSYYERNANSKTLYIQGEIAGRAGEQGIVILDFGRPAAGLQGYGTMSYNGRFVPLPSILSGVESYTRAYFRFAPAGTVLDVAVGTNNSCSTGQPCGTGTCGCRDEPASFYRWGAEFALAVEQLASWASGYRAYYGYSDVVRVVAADDAEPAYDPGFTNTYEVLAGYAATVGGTQPAMVDDGSAEGHFWSESELLQVAYGFRPDVPMPQVYFPQQVGEWAALTRYAKARYGVKMDIFGVLTTGAGAFKPGVAYAAMLSALSRTTAQSAIPWLSNIGL